MTNQTKKKAFLDSLEASKNFQELTTKDQEELKLIYRDADEDQLALALEEISMDEAEYVALEDENAKLATEQEALTKNLKQALHDTQKKEMDENMAEDKKESAKAAEAALHELD